ncbi:MAG: TetR/AcrR family transcriptional regulator [Mycobacterium sp.]
MPNTAGKRQTTPRAAQAAETRQRLVAAAVDLFSKKSYDDVAAGDIAKAAGVAHGLLFHYFGSKRGIYLQALREAVDQLDEAFSFESNLPPPQQLRRALTSNLHYLSRRRGLALRLVLGGRGADSEAWEVFEAGRWRAIGATWAMLGLDPDNHALRITGRAAVAAIDEATVYWLNDEQRFSVETMVEYMVELLAAGLRSAATLDPTLDVVVAIETLLEDQ